MCAQAVGLQTHQCHKKRYMWARYVLSNISKQMLLAQRGLSGWQFEPNYNLSPTQIGLVVTTGERQ
ncbi:hypothetical protein DF947_10685 [Pedobacter paludis]|uniref:Uncharacterized protein n=1 Tax=Pedobacter paludis TaxID=2203212 RepID=A0A317F418_9SPHI|nr:hypothetical protein DF947_10685 [Pedobacter paludis]